MKVTVVGLGRLGLPLAGFYLTAGHDVTGADVSAARLAVIASLGPEVSLEPGLSAALAAGAAEGRWRALPDTAAAVAGAEIVIVIVPVHARGADSIDLSLLDAAVAEVAAGLSVGATVILESTVPARTTLDRVLPVLQRAGRIHGRDFWLAYSPERVSVGTVFRDLRGYPKIVGGIDPEATRRAAAFYRESLGLETWEVANTQTAEFVKLIETTYRDTNIGLANSFAMAADALGIDAIEAIRSANSQPYSSILSPGVGVGGNCIPVYPYLYAASVPRGAELPLGARVVNDGMADYAVRRLEEARGGSLAGARVLVLGVTYRPGVKDTSNSSALLLLARLRAAGATVLAADPLLSDAELAAFGFEPAQGPAFAPADAIIVQSLAPEHADLAWLRATGAKVVLDGRNVLDAGAVVALGARYLGIGR